MATIHQWLKAVNFNFKCGIILYQPVEIYEDYYPSPGWTTPASAELVGENHTILHKEFHNGFGSPQCPRFVAKDDQAIYFPCQYDGATNIQKVWLDLNKYLDFNNHHTPYPGG